LLGPPAGAKADRKPYVSNTIEHMPSGIIRFLQHAEGGSSSSVTSGGVKKVPPVVLGVALYNYLTRVSGDLG